MLVNVSYHCKAAHVVFMWNSAMLFVFIHTRFEAIVPGNPEIVVEYKNKLYCLETEEKLWKFMRSVCITVYLISTCFCEEITGFMQMPF